MPRALERGLETARAAFGFGEQLLNALAALSLLRELAAGLRAQPRLLGSAHAELERERAQQRQCRDGASRDQRAFRGARALRRGERAESQFVLALPRAELDLRAQARFGRRAFHLRAPDAFEPCLLFAPAELLASGLLALRGGAACLFVRALYCLTSLPRFFRRAALRVPDALFFDALPFVSEQ